MDSSDFRRSDNVEDRRGLLYGLLTLLRNPLRNQWYGDAELPGRWRERPIPQNMGEQAPFPVTDLPVGPLSSQAGLDDLGLLGAYLRGRR